MSFFSNYIAGIIIVFLLLLTACADKNKPAVSGVFGEEDTTDNYDLPDIQNNGELIILTLYGPDTYFEFRDEEFGNQFKIAQDFAKSIGASVRVKVCKSEKELKEKLENGEGDLIAYDLIIDSLDNDICYCGVGLLKHFLDSLAVVEHDKTIKTEGNVAWAVRNTSPLLEKRLIAWMNDNENRFFEISQPKVRNVNDRRKYTAYVSDEFFPDIPAFYDYPGNDNLSGGQLTYPYDAHYGPKGLISYYDNLFIKYASYCGWDWRLLAAVAYNESSFNPYAVSPMGAMGLMQLMPSTARHYGVTDAFDPEQSVKAAVKLFANLLAHYAAVPDPGERINFALAAYNAGPGHVDDARRLAQKRGKDQNIWKNNVDEFVLFMSNPGYYNDPVVKYGYFRGGETYNYVNYIRSDWEKFQKK